MTKRSFALLGDVAFRRGITEVRSIQARFDEALEHFNMAAMRGGQVYTGARVWVDAITRLRAEFRKLALSSGVDPDLLLPNTAPNPLPKEPRVPQKAESPPAAEIPEATPPENKPDSTSGGVPSEL